MARFPGSNFSAETNLGQDIIKYEHEDMNRRQSLGLRGACDYQLVGVPDVQRFGVGALEMDQ